MVIARVPYHPTATAGNDGLARYRRQSMDAEGSERSAAAQTPAFGALVLRDGANESGNQRPQFFQRGNVHEQGDVAADFLLMDLELDVQEEHEA